MCKDYSKWVACHGNASSITDREITTYAKDLTLRYPIKMIFNGDMIRFHFSNLTGTEPVSISYATVAPQISGNQIDVSKIVYITFNQNRSFTLLPGEEIVSDNISFDVIRGQTLCVSIYLEGYTQMNTGVLITGPLSKGYYSYGNFADKDILPMDLTRSTNWFYFLNTIDVHTSSDNHAVILYGDSITAQDWPDYLQLLAFENNISNISFIRRAISGTRILREYHCITYAAYGACGEKRFGRETDVAGADTLLIQHGINDIIHPVGSEINPFRPMSDLPTADDLIKGVQDLYIKPAKDKNLKLYSGTLLPIYGWRTYEDFREIIRNEFNDYLRNSEDFYKCADFDNAIKDLTNPLMMASEYDSGDHLHPSKAGYQLMAKVAFETLI